MSGSAAGGESRVLSPRTGLLYLAIVAAIFGGLFLGVDLLFEAAPEVPYNGFDLSAALIDPAEVLIAMRIGGLRPLDEPPPWPGERAGEIARRFLVPSDRVAVVTIEGETRAYPLRVLVFHEVIGDVLGGTPIAVVHHPLSGVTAVFDRRIGGETLRFGPSGLVVDSHPLLFDRPPGDDLALLGRSSLWSPLLGRAISGPRAGAKLSLLPCEVTTWEDFRTRFPDGTIPEPPYAYRKEYRKDLYNQYVGAQKLRYPVDPLPAGSPRPLFAPMLIAEVEDEHGRRTLADAIPEIIGRWSGPDRELSAEGARGIDGIPPRIVDRALGVVTVTGPKVRSVRQAYWFAWNAAEAMAAEITARSADGE